jgi:hypothetical protein
MSQPAISEDEKRVIAELTAWMRKQFGWSSEKKHLWKDDWTLIVKLHAMIETCLNGALVKELDRTGLASVIAKLDTSNPSTGKVAFAKALGGIMPKDSAVFLQKLSELRNLCVHDVRNFEFQSHRPFDADRKREEKRFSEGMSKDGEARAPCHHMSARIAAYRSDEYNARTHGSRSSLRTPGLEETASPFESRTI